MPNTDFTFESVQTYNGSSYGDMTLEAQRPGGTSFGSFVETSHFLYLGHGSKFDMAIFDIDQAGSLGTLKYEYYNGSAWIEFNPLSAYGSIDPDDNEGTQYAFDQDGAEIFPQNRLDSWATTAINSVTKYWVRISSPTSVTQNPTFKQIKMRPIASYCTTKDVYELMQQGAVLGGTDFTSSTTPTQDQVEQIINRSESYIDFKTRKSWKPLYNSEEIHQFNAYGIKLDRPDPTKILSLKVWDGSSWESKTQGRSNDYFLVPDTGMIHFARDFRLPARFYGRCTFTGGEFTSRVKITYLSGKDINFDSRAAGIISSAAMKLAAIEISKNADFGGGFTSGLDRVSLSERIDTWTQEINEQLDTLTAWTTF